VPPHSSPRLAARAAVALGIVMLLITCDLDVGGGGSATGSSGWSYTPPLPPLSRFLWTIVGQGEIARTTGGCRLRMPKVEIEEFAGSGGYLQGSVARITYLDAVGKLHNREEVYLGANQVELQLGVMRYEGNAKRTVELVFETPMNPRPHDGLRSVEWDINYYEDTKTVLDQFSIRISVPLDRFDLGPDL
jgi:hypothetical protein